MLEDLAQRFGANRRHVPSVAFRLLGSAADDEARATARLVLGPSAASIVARRVQSARLKVSRADAEDVDNLTGWFTTITAREAFDQSRAPKRRAEQPLADQDELERIWTAASRLLDSLAPDVVRRVDRVLVPDDLPVQPRGAREVAEETRQFGRRTQAGVVLFIDGAPGIAIAPAGRLQALLRIRIGDDGRTHAIDIGGADRLRTATRALPSLSAAAPRITTATSVTKDDADLTRGQERHVR